MAENTKNLCAQIPESLHTKVRQEQEQSGQPLSQYMTWLITTFYEQEGKTTMKENQRTVAFQVPAELFEQFKDYLKRKGLKQNAFFLSCIQRVLEEGDAQNADNQGQKIDVKDKNGGSIGSAQAVPSREPDHITNN